MPILLTTAYNPGDADPGQTYPRAKITAFTLIPDSKILEVQVEYGDYVSGVWTRGKAERVHHVIQGAAYDTMIGSALPTDANELIYDGASRTLYQHMIDNAVFAGTIE